ncbi:hypothetical protein BDZ90DRAFT_277900 [Jaminaea rosea]|uniref:Histone chaperone domain-containing protein n=1 Tax=Jaminaea rosea TaxID=1569628 RepID=A0A316UWF0_9BASI|nr:hypothetical protein BDZ90DRAFT_277900 [Jaminaea rosea]PWN29637.1 hypothetical protein BDZ90DRAFT_277900 [Jaminaea rosea]
MSDAAAPTDVSTGASVAAAGQDPSTKEVAAETVSSSSKGKGKAVEEENDNDDEDDDDDDDDSDDDEDDDEDDEDIEPDEVDPTNISAPGIGNRPTRSRKPIDYSSEEAQKAAGFDPDQSADDEDEDQEFKGDTSMDS